MEENMKEVLFNEYCKTCKHRAKKEDETPCDECLSNPTNVSSHKPVKYEEDETKKKKKEK